MLKLACILDNPGEPPTRTQYRDPAVLRELGYNGRVIYQTTGLSGLERPEAINDPELRQWVGEHTNTVCQEIEAATAAGLDVFLCYDAFVLARNLIVRQGAELCCKGRDNVVCPASDAALMHSTEALESLVSRLPDIAGVVLRFGDTDASRLPYLIGNDLYKTRCPRCAGASAADRIVKTINAFKQTVVDRLEKKLIVRAWNIRPGGLHDSVELARDVSARLGDQVNDSRMILSFKFTQTDFWRYQQWNRPSQQWGGHPVIFELECQREYEGKGGIPNWQTPIWRDGAAETRDADGGGAGLAAMANRVNYAGILAWVRGGGWGGPFVESEQWIDANVFAAPQLADDPTIDSITLARNWVRTRLGLGDDETIDSIANMLERSPSIILQGFYLGPVANNQATDAPPRRHWIEDDLINVDAAWQMIQELPDSALDELVREKSISVENIAADRALFRRAAVGDAARVVDPLVNTLQYAESLFTALRDLLGGLVAWRRYQASADPQLAALCKRLLIASQSHWNHHTQRCAALPGCATAFREHHFWEKTQDILAELAGAEIIA